MDAVILAGDRPVQGEPLFTLTGGAPKAMLPLLNRPMISYVIAALSAVPEIERLAVIGLGSQEWSAVQEQRHEMDDLASPPVTVLPDQGGLLENLKAGRAWVRRVDSSSIHFVASSCDIPAITPASIRAFISECLTTDHDFYYGVVEKRIMERVFPGSRRTYAPMREGRFCGCDLSLIRVDIAEKRLDRVEHLIARRKSVWRLARLIGLGPLFQLATGRLSLAETEWLASQALGIRGRAVLCPYPELAMDVDKPFQLEIVREYLQRRDLTEGASRAEA